MCLQEERCRRRHFAYSGGQGPSHPKIEIPGHQIYFQQAEERCPKKSAQKQFLSIFSVIWPICRQPHQYKTHSSICISQTSTADQSILPSMRRNGTGAAQQQMSLPQVWSSGGYIAADVVHASTGKKISHLRRGRIGPQSF